MNSLVGKDTWPLLKINDDLLDRLRTMGAEGATPTAMIDFLHTQGVPKPGAVLALRLTKVMPVSETKAAVHLSEAYAYRREADEAFEESVIQAMDEIERSEAAA
jgi:hypothetical protein